MLAATGMPTCMDLPKLQMKKRLGIDSILREEKGQWWGNTECIINCKAAFEPASAVKSLNSFLTSFVRCHRDIANLPRYFGHA